MQFPVLFYDSIFRYEHLLLSELSLELAGRKLWLLSELQIII
jgi:hypothetical protein